MLLNVLAVGDVVGEGGQDILSRRLPGLREETGAHFCVVNGENASGVGITPAQARRVLEAGADVITLGNHTWNRIQIGAFLDKEDRILRPANYAGRVPGRGFGVYRCQGLALGVLNIMGRVDLNSNLDSPFKAANYFWNRGGFDLLLVDFHAEATSEKFCLAWDFDGRVSAVIGTHTHIQTADERILPGGTGYITDAGMCGAFNSSLGVKPQQAIRRLRTRLPTRFENDGGPCRMSGVLLEIDPRTLRTTAIQRVNVE